MHCYVQTSDFGTKVRNLFNAAKGCVPKRHCSCYRGKPLNDSTHVGTIPEMDKDHHNRQRIRVLPSRVDYEKVEHKSVLCRSSCTMAKRWHRKHKRPHKAIHTKRYRFQECKSTEDKNDTKKN